MEMFYEKTGSYIYLTKFEGVRFGYILMLGILLAALLPMGSASPVIGNIDDYSKISHGNELTFNWTFYNPDNITYRIEVRYELPSGWSATSSEDSFDLRQGEEHNFYIKIKPGEKPNNGDFSIIFREIPYENPSEQRNATYHGTLTYSPVVEVRSLTFFEELLKDGLGIEIEDKMTAFFVNFILWVLLGMALVFIMDPLLKKAAEKTETPIDDMIIEIIRGPLLIFLAVYGFASSIYILSPSLDTVILVGKTYDVIVILLISWVAYKIFRDVVIYEVKKYSKKTKSQLDDALIPLAEKLGIIVIIFFAFTAVLGYMGVNVTMLVAGMGVLGLVVAFAAQDTLSNFFSGIHLLLDRPFKEGDIIMLETGEYCEVRHVGMRSTKLYNTFDHDMIIVPNNQIAGQKIVNISTPDANFKVRFPIDVSYDSDPDEVKKTIMDVAMSHPNVIKEGDKAPLVRLVDFLDSNIRYKVYLWVDDAMNQWKVEAEMKEKLLKIFREKGIEISYPQHVVRLKKEEQ